MLALLITTCVFVGVMLYATIAIATGQICYVRMIDGDCREKGNGKHLPKQNDRDRTGVYCACRSYGGLVGGFWPIALPSWVLIKLVIFMAKGPTKWGLALADVGKPRQRAALGRMTAEELAALEVECGLRDG